MDIRGRLINIRPGVLTVHGQHVIDLLLLVILVYHAVVKLAVLHREVPNREAAPRVKRCLRPQLVLLRVQTTFSVLGNALRKLRDR